MIETKKYEFDLNRPLFLYAVMNNKDQFYHRSHGTWNFDIKKAKVYTRIGNAKATLTYLKRRYKGNIAFEDKPPRVVEFVIDKLNVLFEENNLKK
jgi:hypothetical protein